MAGIKFRPSLTIDDIQFIYDTLHTLPSSPQQQSILASLHKMILKARHGIITPSHLALGKQSIESQLGFSSQDHTIERTQYINQFVRVYVPEVFNKSQFL